MIQPISRPQSSLSYNDAARYAAGMLDSRLSRSPERGFAKGHAGQALATRKMAFFCAIRQKTTQNKISCFC